MASGTWATLWIHDVDAVDRLADTALVADVARHELDAVGRPIVGSSRSSTRTACPAAPQALDEQRTEVAAARR